MSRSARRFNRFSMTNPMLAHLGLVSADPDGGDTGGGGQPAGSDPSKDTGKTGSGDSGQGATDTGFPANTPWRDMEPAQQVAYWQAQSRKHEGRAADRADYDDLKAKAAKFDEQQRASETEHEKALREARETAIAEGRQQALAESSTATVKALLEGALKMRGQSDADIADSTRHVNLSSFVTNGEVDHDAITSLVTRLAGPAGAGDTGRGPDFGLGNRGRRTQSAPGQAGLDEASRRFGKPADAAK